MREEIGMGAFCSPMVAWNPRNEVSWRQVRSEALVGWGTGKEAAGSFSPHF